MSGRDIDLRIYVDRKIAKQMCACDDSPSVPCRRRGHGRSNDLDIFMIVRGETISIGAMENQGPLIFSKTPVVVLAHADTATDLASSGSKPVVAARIFP